jgi:hypothetical protein
MYLEHSKLEVTNKFILRGSCNTIATHPNHWLMLQASFFLIKTVKKL